MLFWRPSIWDLIGVALSAAGIFLTGIVSISLGGYHVIGIVCAILLIVLSIIVFLRFHESSAYPFVVHFMKSTIVFSLDPNSDAPIGRMSREMEVSLRASSPETVDRFVFLTDPPTLTNSHVRTRLRLQAKLLTGKKNQISRSIEPEIRLSEFRKLEMCYSLPEEAKQFRRFRFTETFMLPNEFSGSDEYYDISIHENARRRIVRFEFENIKLMSARFAIIRGKRAPIYHEAEIQRDESNDTAFIEREFRNFSLGDLLALRKNNLRVGDVLSFRWNWGFAKAPDGSKPAPRRAVARSRAAESER